MNLTWQEIRDKAIIFRERWKNASNERAEAQTFLYELLRDVYGVDPRRVGTFEKKVHPTTDTNGYIDLLWPGRILIEMKSKGKSLDKAHEQARKYAFSIDNDDDLPVYILVCDFARFRLYNLTTNQVWEFDLKDLPDNVQLLSIFTERATKYDLIVDKELNTQAAYKMAKLHDMLRKNGYTGHALELYLVRILFCLFADHTGIFNRHQFHKYIADSKEDGSDLAGRIGTLFEVLNTAPNERMTTLSFELQDFPYVNGGMFKEILRSASFDAQMRDILLECCSFDWSDISPAIFGAMFQSVMDPEKRITLGEQYTPQYIIKKVLKPLFIDELYSEFEKSKSTRFHMEAFHKKIASLRFLDPACGCGNFLIVAYTMLRRLELDIIRFLYPRNDELPNDFNLENLVKVNVGQFYGIEIEEFPCQIAQAGLWLVDHKMNLEASNIFGKPFVRIPLTDCAHIFHGNALTNDWGVITENKKVDFIFGNPPFYGAKKLTTRQRSEVQSVFVNSRHSGLLDYVAAWYMRAATYMQNTHIKCAFVSTNSIIQGEQVAILWEPLIEELSVVLTFGYQAFKWTNEAKDMATVHCVIIGFQCFSDTKEKTIYYEDDTFAKVSLLNPYLDGLPVITLVKRRSKPLCNVPEIGIGNKPIDDGNYLFTEEEKNEFVLLEPLSQKWFREWYGSREFINKTPRYCLWLRNCSPNELAKMPYARKRVEAVREYRRKSPSKPTNAIADTPRRFHVENFPTCPYLVIPEVSSERRDYIPMGFMDPSVLCSNLVKIMRNATLYHFGILTSSIHMIWTRAVCGRLEERYRYSAEVVYNNFPWPTPTEKQREEILICAQNVLNVRNNYSECSYKVLYTANTMPEDLLKAHKKLDNAVKAAYGLSALATERDCIIELYRLYRKLEQQSRA